MADVEEPTCEELEKVLIDDDPKKFFQAPGVDPNFICRHLNVNAAVVLRKQPPRHLSKEHAEAIKEEVLKFKKLLVATVGHPRMSFLDAFSGLLPNTLGFDDQEKVASVTPTWNYHYKMPVYYMSKSLHEAEVHYLPLEKAILTVVYATHKLPHYFQSLTVVVLTQLLPKSILRSADYMGRIAKWGTILEAFDIKYMPRTSMKGQILADQVAKFAKPSIEENVKKLDMDEKSVGVITCKERLIWKVYIDGAENQRGSGMGLVLVSPEGLTFEKSLRLGFSAINNEAEYEALLVGMDMVQKMGGKTVQIFSDSQLVMGQVEGKLEARDPRMQEYLTQVR
ncbi:uncharacterized protein LOC142611975 [Castanea sativa]|uniref:uncharacterized protein LOC142611975 n=1 Tax=Castanea sativa TaxID=21020 RepID=UPI003F64AD42